MTDFKLGIVRLGRVAGKVSGTGRGLGRWARRRGWGWGWVGAAGPGRGHRARRLCGWRAGGVSPRGHPPWAAAWGSDGAPRPGRRRPQAAPAARGPQRPSDAARSLLAGTGVCAPLRACGSWWRFAQVSRGQRGPRLAEPPWAPPRPGLPLLLSRPRPRPPRGRGWGSRHLWALRLGCFQEPAGRAADQPRTVPWMGTLFPSPAAEASGGRGAEAVR